MRNLIIIGISLIMLLNSSCNKKSDRVLHKPGTSQKNYIVRRLFLPMDADKIVLNLSALVPVDLWVLPDIVTDVPLWEQLKPTSTNRSAYIYNLTPIIHNPTRYFRLNNLKPSDYNADVSILVKIEMPPENIADVHFELETIKNNKAIQTPLDFNNTNKNNRATSEIDEQGWMILDISAKTKRSNWIKNKNPLKDLPIGRTEFAGIPYKIEDNIRTFNSSESQVDIDVNRYITALHFLHVVDQADKIPLRVATYIIHYKNGQTRTIPVVTGINIMNLTSGYGRGGSTMGSVDVQNAPVAWRGHYYGLPGLQNASVYSYCWRNPEPDMEISDITIKPAESGKLGLIAITAEGGSARKILAQAVPSKYLFTTNEHNISTDLILENITGKNIPCTGELSLTEVSSGNSIDTIKINELLAPRSTICNSYMFKTDIPLVLGCYDITFTGKSGKTIVQSKSIRISVTEPYGRLIKGKFPKKHRAFYTMTIGDLDNRSAQKLSALGFDIAYIQPRWASMETAPGKYDFSIIDKTVSVATNNHLALALGAVTWTTKDYGTNYGIPDWIKGQMISRMGTIVKDGTIFNEKYRESLVSFWSALAGHAAGIPAVVAYVPTGPGNDHMLNFGGGIYGKPGHLYDYSSYAATSWKEWLENNSGYSLSDLSKITGVKLKNYSDIPMPKYKKDYGIELWRLWLTFRRDYVIESWNRITSAIRDKDTNANIEIKHSGGWLPWGNLQGSYFDGMINVAEKCGGSLLKTGSEWTDQFIVTSPLAAHRGISVGAEMAILPPPREAFQKAIFNLMRYQANQAVYVYWDVGEPTYNWAEYKPAWNRVLSSEILKNRLCLLYSTWSMINDGVVEKDEVDLHREETLGWGYLLSDKGIYFDATTDQENISLNKYSVIIDTNSGGHPDDYWKKLEEYVRVGGTLVLPYRAGASQNYKFQHEVLGVSFAKKAEGEIHWRNTSGSFDDYSADTGMVLTATNADVIARWEDNSPAAVEISLGKGKVLCLGFPVIKYKSQAEKILKNIFRMYNVIPFVNAPSSLQTALFKEDDKRYLMIAFNHDVKSNKTITLQLPEAENHINVTYRITNILTGRQVEITPSNNGSIIFTMPYRGLTTEVLSIKRLKM